MPLKISVYALESNNGENTEVRVWTEIGGENITDAENEIQHALVGMINTAIKNISVEMYHEAEDENLEPMLNIIERERRVQLTDDGKE